METRCRPRPGAKPLEPHGRVQGATNLRGRIRSKPSEPGGTAKAEGVGHLAVSGRSGRSSGTESGTGRMRRQRRRGDLWKTTREEVRSDMLARSGVARRRCGASRTNEPLGPDRVFEDDGKERGSQMCRRLHAAPETGKPRRLSAQREKSGGQATKANRVAPGAGDENRQSVSTRSMDSTALSSPLTPGKASTRSHVNAVHLSRKRKPLKWTPP